MGLAGRLRSDLRRLRAALQPMRERGLGWATVLLRQLPAGVALRAWRRAVRPLNGGLLGALGNGPRLRRFLRALPATAQPRLIVIVMPQVLHFLLPCLALLRGHAHLVLLANGAQDWELHMLREHLPEAPQLRLLHLPGSSVDHGDVLSLLIEHHPGPFAIVDHDCYVLDQRLLAQLVPRPDECMVALFADHHPHLGFALPLTHCLALNAEPLRALMHEHGVSARVARRTPASAQPAFTRIGLPPGGTFKPYQRFHDTLHVLLALALDRGLHVRVPATEGELPIAHVGGTSIGSHHTKNLFALHVHLRFLELLGDARLRDRYRFLTWPLTTADQALSRSRPGDPTWQGLPLIDTLMPRLRQALHRAWPERYPPGEESPP